MGNRQENEERQTSFTAIIFLSSKHQRIKEEIVICKPLITSLN